MDRNLNLFEELRFRFAGRKDNNVFGQAEALTDLTCGIMIPRDNEDLNPRIFKFDHPAVEKQSSVEVAPVTIVKVSGQQNKGYILLNSEIDKVVKCSSGCTAYFIKWSILWQLKANQRAVEVYISRV
jgi:hypothetical protein